MEISISILIESIIGLANVMITTFNSLISIFIFIFIYFYFYAGFEFFFLFPFSFYFIYLLS